MNPTQLRIQELGADKTLQLGCIIKYKNNNGTFEAVMLSDELFWNNDESEVSDVIEDLFYETNICDCGFKMKKIIGKPFDYARLVYLIDGRFDSTIDQILLEFDCNRELYQETVLEWSEELNKLILEFLESIYPDKKVLPSII